MLPLAFVAHLPRLDGDCARNGLATRGEYATLDIYILSLAFRHDQLSEWDYGRNGHEMRRLMVKEGEGMWRRRELN